MKVVVRSYRNERGCAMHTEEEGSVSLRVDARKMNKARMRFAVHMEKVLTVCRHTGGCEKQAQKKGLCIAHG
jgi:hypothetical protein